jgi:formylglycine-generating enzyme
MAKINFMVLFFTLLIQNVKDKMTTVPEKPEMVFVEGGTFNMGSNDGDAEEDEMPIHRVTVNSFSIGKHEVTVSQYMTYCKDVGKEMPDMPEWGWRDNYPMVGVSWYDAVTYCDWLSEKFGGNWRLPTEAEWEYAARGGRISKGYRYAGGNDIESVAWFDDNSDGKVSRVGRKRPNELGIYDMSGNVSEWCQDWYDEDYYKNSPSTNPRGPTSKILIFVEEEFTTKVVRGGSYDDTDYCRLASREFLFPDESQLFTGFRVVLSQ